MQRLLALFFALVLSVSLAASQAAAQQSSAQQSAISADPLTDHAHPATMESVQIPSHGALLNGLVYIAAGAGPHPVALLLHGFPGNERNLDLAQTLRRAGWDVVYFNYRGAWGAPGEFSFAHCIEDAQAAIAWLHDPAVAAKLRANPSQLVLLGHSMGGFVANEVAARTPGIKAVVTMSAANMGMEAIRQVPPQARNVAVTKVAEHLAKEGMAPLAGCTPEGLAKELAANLTQWDFPTLASKLTKIPYLILTSDDGLAPSNDAFGAALKSNGNTQIATKHFATDHGYSDQRIALQTTILDWLAKL
jgi:pimeloyl-ACP methyl ester carboxylesterase